MRWIDEDVSVVAEMMRTMGSQRTPPFSVIAILGSAFPSAVVMGRTLPDGIDEVVSALHDGALIIYRRELSTAARRFAIAHAIAHLIWDVRNGRIPSVAVIDEEREARADAFALELLAPDRILLPRVVFWPESGEHADLYYDQVDRLAAAFHVPVDKIDSRIRRMEREANLSCVGA